MDIVIGIPARMGASRFPGKPLCSILGAPMIEHVYRRCALTKDSRVFVATCDEEIGDAVRKIGGEVIMTRPEIERPALRVAEASQTLGMKPDDLLVVVQGDEPLVNPGMLELGIKTLLDNPDVLCTNLCATATEEDLKDPNEVKVVVDANYNALYMSRSPIPYATGKRQAPMLRQLGIFFFRYEALQRFQALEPTLLERTESIEMLRAIEHGKKVRMVHSPFQSKGVDTDQDRLEAERLMQNDPVWKDYANSIGVKNA